MENIIEKITGNIISLKKKKVFKGEISVKNGKIVEINECENVDNVFIMPGFVDSHIHIESSMLTPFEFSRIAVTHGTIGIVTDPHEIANVLGEQGLEYMLESAKEADLKISFGVPSCVPATNFETSGALLNSNKVDKLLKSNNFNHLAEMMNFPGVIFEDSEVISKLESAKKYNKPIDGHAPGLKGDSLKKYVESGISTDHECFSIDEAKEKIKLGMNILIREGSAAKNFEELHSLIESNNNNCMFCSDDLHPDDLKKGHINLLVKKAFAKGYDLFDILNCAISNSINHYSLDIGSLNEGDNADFIIVDNLKEFNILKTVINGKIVAENGQPKQKYKKPQLINNFKCNKFQLKDFQVPFENKMAKIIVAIDGSLITNVELANLKNKNEFAISDTENDILKIAVVNRYSSNSKPFVGFIKGFNLKKGAIASSIAHDSHNIVAVGTDDDSLVKAVNLIVENKGGLVYCDKEIEVVLPLPVAGIISDLDCLKVSEIYEKLNKIFFENGSRLKAPFMTLSFMALPVIPSLKITDKGLFDVEKFQFTKLYS